MFKFNVSLYFNLAALVLHGLLGGKHIRMVWFSIFLTPITVFKIHEGIHRLRHTRPQSSISMSGTKL